MKKLLMAILVLAVLMIPAALAEYTMLTTESVDIRSGPGLEYAVVDTVDENTVMNWEDGVRTDDRGVEWYEISYEDYAGSPTGEYWLPSDAVDLVGAVILATGDTFLRTGPGLEYDVLEAVDANTFQMWDGDFRDDARGVEWYGVRYFDEDGEDETPAWIASTRSEILYFTEDDDFLADFEDAADRDIEYDPEEVPDYVEIMDWYGEPLFTTAQALDLPWSAYVPSEMGEYVYYDDGIYIYGYSAFEHCAICGQGYTIYGIHPGMDVKTAEERLARVGLADEGLDLTDGNRCYRLDLDEGGDDDFKKCMWIEIEFNDDDIVTMVAMYTDWNWP